ncbi:DNA-binding transcriptional regulator, MarR family [Desulfotomaculum arcticum]|uniref:DNA-binding transcriptional regulator, MarR family n=1 Tax=Desulfotruncus arcticus DSM 17038 TaxID=1121424 RepID=A0A1I2QU94_9FIRM|nr:MarR family transcriptional regulator [Desulfotruncus arcticus]SFG29206.1 DNA-binding transcriptional regulator, MarR family [Desulfotomaculum arcticum] [Desulfotruncus arcticus DSM 17038]
MNSNSDIYEFLLDNVQKIIVPEEIITLELSISRYEFLALQLSEKFRTITMSNLAQGMAVPMSTATGIVDRLVKKGLLKRGRSEEDRRVVTVSLTDSGKSLVEDLKEHFRDFLDRIRSLLTEEEFETGLKLVRKVIVGFQKGAQNPVQESAQQRRSIKIE